MVRQNIDAEATIAPIGLEEGFCLGVDGNSETYSKKVDEQL